MPYPTTNVPAITYDRENEKEVGLNMKIQFYENIILA